MRLLRSRWGLLAIAAASAIWHAPAPAEARGLNLGFVGFESKDVPIATFFDDARAVDAGTVRLPAWWSDIAPLRPATAADPSDAAYRWTELDNAVTAARARGLDVILMLSRAPAWAEGQGRPTDAARGTWRPSAQAFGDFATAAARRYSGDFTDPRNPATKLPRVRFWQAWNEPNLSHYLSPQWVRSGDGFRPASPSSYRSLLNAFHGGVKKVRADNTVITAGAAPYGDPTPGGQRIMPVRFLRDLLCVAPQLSKRSCASPTRFDILAHHPYGIRGPESHALNDDDAAIPDVAKLQRVVRAGLRFGTVLPKHPKRTWVTEVSWDSSPPDPFGVPEMRHAQWLQRAMYVLWRQGVDTVLWYRVRDEPPIPSYAASYQSGVLFADGAPKLAATAFRFPFVVRRAGKQALVWGRSPALGRLSIQRKTGGRWREIARRPVGVGTVFTKRIAIRKGTLRARVAGQTSLPAPVR
jgi:hypothetical protein